MSQAMSIDISFVNCLNMHQLMSSLKTAGWGFSDNGEIVFLPLGDKDFDWQGLPLSDESKVLKIIAAKEKVKEPVGINISWEKSNIGGSLLYFHDSNTLSFTASLNRKKLNEDPFNRFTAIDWYYSKLLKVAFNLPNEIFSVEITDIP